MIYKATNNVNGKVYIGKTVQYLEIRKKQHKYDACNDNKRRYNCIFHMAIRKYGWDNFKWEILCEIDSENKLNVLEKFYIAAYRKMGNIYNLTDGGEGASGNIISEETRNKLKNRIPWNKGNGNYMTGNRNHFYGKMHSGETKQKISKTKKGSSPAPNKGKHLTNETKQKLRDFNLGRHHTEETKIKISETLKKRPPEIIEKIIETRKANGYKHSDDTKRKMSKSIKLFYKNKKLMEA
jgi:group I intron endonuclease